MASLWPRGAGGKVLTVALYHVLLLKVIAHSSLHQVAHVGAKTTDQDAGFNEKKMKWGKNG